MSPTLTDAATAGRDATDGLAALEQRGSTAEAFGIPLAVLAELTHRCPLQCPYCSNPIELDRGGSETIPLWLAAIGPVLLLCQLLMRRLQFAAYACALSLPQFAFVYGGVWAFALSMLPLGYRPFIYFQF